MYSEPSSPIRALYIAEVLEMILDQLVDDLRTMSHLAFTCKAILEPTMDRLWALNDSLEPFVSLLPKELTLDENSFFQFDPLAVSNLSLEDWVTFDNYARRARRLYVKTVTMSPHRVYSSIYKQLTRIRPNVELFPNLNILAFHARRVPDPHRRLFPSSLRFITFSWANAMAPKVESVLWSSVMNRLLLDSPLVEHIHFEGSPKETLNSLVPFPFQRLRKITIKPNPLRPSVLHIYCHAFSTISIQELDLRFVRWPDSRLQPLSPVFPWLKKLIIDGPPSYSIEFIQLLSSPLLQEMLIVSQIERSGDTLHQYAELLMLIASKYRGVFKTLKVQHPLHCLNQVDLGILLHAVRTLTDAGADVICLNLIVGWQDLTREVQDKIDSLKAIVPRQFRISTRRTSQPWFWSVGNVLSG